MHKYGFFIQMCMCMTIYMCMYTQWSKKGCKTLFGGCRCAIMKHFCSTTVTLREEPADLMVLCKEPLQLTLDDHLDHPEGDHSSDHS